MRLIPIKLSTLVILLGLLALAAAPSAQASRAEPLDVPAGRGPAPDQGLDRPLLERVAAAESELNERGYSELPVLAWSLLDPAGASPGAIERAVELAPNTPSVLFEAARLSKNPEWLVAAVSSLIHSFPGLVWLVTLAGAALGLGAFLAATWAIAIGFLRTVSLHGHALGHAMTAQDPPSWPGVLIALAGLALVPLAGFGPAVLLALAGALAAMRTERRGSIFVALAVATLGIVLGPALDQWARIAVMQGRDGAALVVWRVDRAQPLPGDRQRLELAVAGEPDDLLLRLGLATAAKGEGDIAAAKQALALVPETGTVALHAQASNMLGILHLADGEVEEAIGAFEDARSTHETASALYNLSQAFARGMRLMERTAPFVAARNLDPELVSRYTAFEGKNVHRFLIQGPFPLAAYLERAFRPSAEAAELAQEIRLWTLGPGAPDWIWLVLPVLGALGFAARRTGIRRCSRCEQPICSRCVVKGRSASTCMRCANLFARGTRVDPRLRQLHLALDRKRQRRMALGRGSLAVLLPGAVRVFDGRFAGGIFALILAGMGVALVMTPGLVALPFEVGGLGAVVPTFLGWLLLGPAYLWALYDAREQLRRAGSRR